MSEVIVDSTDAVMRRVAADLAEHRLALTDAICVRLQEVDGLQGDAFVHDMMRASTASNLDAFVAVVLYGAPPTDSVGPRPAVDYAHRLAQQGIEPSALLSAYRIGLEHALLWTMDRIAAGGWPARVALEATRRVAELAFRYIDAISGQILTEYTQERARWLADTTTARTAVVNRLLADEPVDVELAERTLGYRLRGRHLALVLWTDQSDGSSGLRTLERIYGRVRSVLAGPPGGLFLARDAATAWAWLPVPESGAGEPSVVLRASATELDDAGVSIAVAGPDAGVAGFAAAHREASTVRNLAAIAPSGVPRVLSAADAEVRTAVLLMRDLDSTRRLVAHALGALAADDDQTARLRETTKAFLAANHSYVRTAEILTMHKNTVRYRVEKATALRGRPLDQDRITLDLALIACHWLGARVM